MAPARLLSVFFGPGVFLAVLLGAGEALACHCTANVTGISFGTYDPSKSTNTTANGKITVQCDFKANVKVRLGLVTGETYPTRVLKVSGRTESIQYNLYKDSALVSIWGAESSGNYTGLGPVAIGTSRCQSSKTFTVYGKVPPGQWVAPGLYQSSVPVTIDYTSY